MKPVIGNGIGFVGADRVTTGSGPNAVSRSTLQLAAESAEIKASHPLPEGSWIFSRSTDLPRKPSSNVLAGSSSTPQDRLYFRQIYFLQWHRQMGVMMRDCNGPASWSVPWRALANWHRAAHRPIRAGSTEWCAGSRVGSTDGEGRAWHRLAETSGCDSNCRCRS